MSRHDGESPTRRTTLLGVLLAVLLVVPVAAGLAVAQAGISTPPTPADDAAAATSTTTAGTSPDQGDAISDAPLANAPGSAQDALTPQGDDVDTGIPRLTFVRDDGESFRVQNGGTVGLAGGYEVTVTVDPFPPSTFAIDVELELARDGEPVTDATFDTVWDMTLMTHGPFDTRLDSPAPGTYATGYHFFMFGPWYVDTTVTVPGADPIEFRLSIYVWPA